MNDQYYTADPTSASRPVACTVLFHGHSLRFETDAGVFSKGELDKGTELLLDCLLYTSFDRFQLFFLFVLLTLQWFASNNNIQVLAFHYNRCFFLKLFAGQMDQKIRDTKYRI